MFKIKKLCLKGELIHCMQTKTASDSTRSQIVETIICFSFFITLGMVLVPAEMRQLSLFLVIKGIFLHIKNNTTNLVRLIKMKSYFHSEHCTISQT